jgi:hypothetical protein
VEEQKPFIGIIDSASVLRNFGEQIKIKDDVCVQVSANYSDCKTVTSWSSKQPEKVTFSVD